MYYLKISLLCVLMFNGLLGAMDRTAGLSFFRGHKMLPGLVIKPSMGTAISAPSLGLDELVLMPSVEGMYVPAIVKANKYGHSYLIDPFRADLGTVMLYNELLVLKPLWHCIYQPTVSLARFQAVLERFLSTEACQLSPFVQFRIAEPNKKVLVVGDLHGSFSSLAHHLQDWHEKEIISEDLKLHPDYMLVFTGDYEDRGPDGIEVLYVLMNLKITNPNAVVLIRGNHEQESLLMCHGFHDEWEKKFGFGVDSQVAWGMLMQSFSSMPHALILGRKSGIVYDCVMFCHGGIEQVPDLLKILIYKHIQSPNSPIINHNLNVDCNNDFNWMDFYALDDIDAPEVRLSGRGAGMIAWSRSLLSEYLEEEQAHDGGSQSIHYFLRALFRGHQHIGGGITRLLHFTQESSSWQKLQDGQDCPVEMYGVYNFISAPEAFSYADMKNDAYGIVSTSNDGWTLRPCIKARV